MYREYSLNAVTRIFELRIVLNRVLAKFSLLVDLAAVLFD